MSLNNRIGNNSCDRSHRNVGRRELFYLFKSGITSIVTLLIGGAVLSATFSTSTDYCLNESFNVSCERNHVILVTSAWFGRMRPGRCISGDFNVGCVKDVKHLLDGVCSLRRSCNVSVRSFVDLHPCQRDFVSYLEARYTCIQVSGLNVNTQCREDSNEIALTGLHSGYATRPRWPLEPSLSTFRNQIVGTAACPWSITVQQGQRLNVSAIVLPAPFNAASLESLSEQSIIEEFSSQIGFSNNDRTPCSSGNAASVDVIIDDLVAKRRIHLRDVICTRSERHLFTSLGNRVRVHVTGDITEVSNKVMLIHFSAVGCPDLEAPPGAAIQKLTDGSDVRIQQQQQQQIETSITGSSSSSSSSSSHQTVMTDNVMIRCNDSMETWYLTCQSNQWLGQVGNCSPPATTNTPISSSSSSGGGGGGGAATSISSSSSKSKTLMPLKVFEQNLSVQYHFDGVIMAIVIGVLLGVCIGMLLLLLLHLVKRCSHSKSPTRSLTTAAAALAAAAAAGDGDSKCASAALISTRPLTKYSVGTYSATTDGDDIPTELELLAPPSSTALSVAGNNGILMDVQTTVHVVQCDCCNGELELDLERVHQPSSGSPSRFNCSDVTFVPDRRSLVSTALDCRMTTQPYHVTNEVTTTGDCNSATQYLRQLSLGVTSEPSPQTRRLFSQQLAIKDQFKRS